MADKWKMWLKDLCRGRKIPPKNQLLILLLVGILLVVIALPVQKKSGTDLNTAGDRTVDTAETEAQDVLADYERNLEKRVADTLEYVQGVGKTEVMITLKTSGEKIIEKDRQTGSQTTTEKDSEGGTRVTEETNSDSVSVYEQEEDGTQSPYVSKEMTPEIEGIIIVAEGGENPVVIQDVTEAIQALFGIEAHKIKIMKRTDT